MTIKDIEKLDHAYTNEGIEVSDFPRYKDMSTEQSLPFFNRIFNEIQNEETKKELYCLLRELAFYQKTCNDIDDLVEFANAYGEERCFIFPFKPGDFIEGPDGVPKKVMCIRMDDAWDYPRIEVEERYVCTDVTVLKDTIKPSDYKLYKKVDNVGEFDLWRNGEGVDYYYDYCSKHNDVYADDYHYDDYCKDHDEDWDW